MGTLAQTNSWSELHTDVSKPGETSKQASTTITGLIGNTEYDIKAIIYDVAGNTNEVTRLAVKTNPTPVTGITVTPTELSLGENETAKLTATVQPDNATDKTVTWRSEEEGIATVEDHKDGTATVTGVKAGTTNIVATAGGQSVKCSVTVENTDLEIELKVEEEKVTGKEIPVTAKVTKAADGTEVKEEITYEFYKNNEPDGTGSQTATHTFQNLDETVEYTLKVVATSEKGKTAETYVTVGVIKIYVDNYNGLPLDTDFHVYLRYTVGTTWEDFINSKYNKKITEDKELQLLTGMAGSVTVPEAVGVNGMPYCCLFVENYNYQPIGVAVGSCSCGKVVSLGSEGPILGTEYTAAELFDGSQGIDEDGYRGRGKLEIYSEFRL